jgi:hypothetical protein
VKITSDITRGLRSRHDFTVAGIFLLLNDDEITVHDADVDHRLATHFEHVTPLAGKHLAGVDFVTPADGFNRFTGGDPPCQWQVQGHLRVAGKRRFRHPVSPLACTVFQPTFPDQCLYVLVYRTAGVDTTFLGNFVQRGCIALAGVQGLDDFHDLLLASCQHLSLPFKPNKTRTKYTKGCPIWQIENIWELFGFRSVLRMSGRVRLKETLQMPVSEAKVLSVYRRVNDKLSLRPNTVWRTIPYHL